MYNSSYFQGGGHSLTSNQIAQTGGDNDDC